VSGREAPAWLAELQERFGAALRSPLGRGTGVLRAQEERYDARLCEEIAPKTWGDERASIAVYNRQYWFRLFTALQGSFPLCAALVGPWRFNEFAERFLVERAPSGWDLDRVSDGFAAFFSAALGEAPEPAAEALREAAEIDEAWRKIFHAAEAPPFRPAPGDAGGLLGARLKLAPTAALVRESWPLLDLRRGLGVVPERAVPLPPRLEAPRSWALLRRPEGVLRVPLEEQEAELLRLLVAHPVLQALGALEARCPEERLDALPGDAQRWLARSVELGLWAA